MIVNLAHRANLTLGADRPFDPVRSGRYDLYLLMVAWCLEKREMTPLQLLQHPPPGALVVSNASKKVGDR